MERKWYQQTWAIIVLLWFFFPVGLYLMWRHATWRPQIKWAVSGVLAVLVVIVAVGSAVGGGTDDADFDQAVIEERTPVEPSPTADDVSDPQETDPTEAPQQASSYSLLAIDDIEVSGTNVNISGRTDLPDGAVVTVGFDVSGRADDDQYIGVDERVEVTNQEFAAMLEIPQRAEFVTGPYEVSVLFTPRGQADSVLELVGVDGQNLSGEFVRESFSFVVLDMVEQVDVQLSVSPPTFVFQQTSAFEAGSPERAVAEFAAAWRDQDWQRMVNYTQLTWLDSSSDAVLDLASTYDFKILMGFEIKRSDAISSVMSDVTILVQYELFTNQVETKEITARVIRESGPYEPSTQGQWGVNPISTLREQDVN